LVVNFLIHLLNNIFCDHQWVKPFIPETQQQQRLQEPPQKILESITKTHTRLLRLSKDLQLQMLRSILMMSLLKEDVLHIPNIMEVSVELDKLLNLVRLQEDGLKNQ